jgi:hypothetical protein
MPRLRRSRRERRGRKRGTGRDPYPLEAACHAGVGLGRDSGGLGRSNGRDTCRKRPARSDRRWRARCVGTAARARPGVRVAGVWESFRESAKARKRRAWRDPWRPVVGRTGRAQARSDRVGFLCLARGVTKPRGSERVGPDLGQQGARLGFRKVGQRDAVAAGGRERRVSLHFADPVLHGPGGTVQT